MDAHPGEDCFAQVETAAAKKFLAHFLISNKKLWEFLLEWVGMRIGTEAAKDFPL